jgi:putative transcriptional regulator
MLETTELKGQLLVAMPQLEDANFHRTAVLLCENTSQGSMGIVINRPLPFQLDKVYEGQPFETKEKSDEPVHYGGPVQPEVGFIIFEGSELDHDAMKVTDDIALGTSIEILKDISEGKGPQRFIFALGYAGWSGGQLEAELARNDWLVVPVDASLLFDVPAPERWEHAIRTLGIDPNLLSQSSGSA